MIQQIEIDGKEYPFLFSFRSIFNFMNGSGLNSLEAAEQQISIDYDSMLSLYAQASEKGAKKADGEALSADEIEDAIDEEPSLFMTLQEAFNNSKALKAMTEEEPEKK